MRSQSKITAFSSNFLGDEIFRKTEGFRRFLVNHPEFCGNCVFYLNDITPRNEVESLQEKDCMAAHFHISIR